MKVRSCVEFVYPVVGTYRINAAGATNPLDYSYMMDLTPYAIAATLIPNGITIDAIDWNTNNVAIMTKPCSNPVMAMNNGREMSYEVTLDTLERVGLPDPADWVGSADAVDRAMSRLQCDFRPFYERQLSACGHDFEGIVYTNFGCYWAWNRDYSDTIELYLGFDAGQAQICTADGDGTMRAIASLVNRYFVSFSLFKLQLRSQIISLYPCALMIFSLRRNIMSR